MSVSKSPSSDSSTPSSYTHESAQATPPEDEVVPQPIPKKSQQIKTDKPRPHTCSVCTRAFARLEHLKRHERSHTNEKPFQCACCGRCFARRDLVLRHQQKLHQTVPTIMRRGSGTKDDSAAQNEYIIILDNNTKANAPLPGEKNPRKRRSAKTDSSSSTSEEQLFSPRGVFPSAIPSPPNASPPVRAKSGSVSGVAGAPAPERAPPTVSHLRHVSFSAASGASYTNIRDALGDDQWNLDSFDLMRRRQSSKNLSSFFQDALVTHTGTEQLDGASAALSFSNPDHPHHLKGMTPFEFGLAPPNYDINMPLPQSQIELDTQDVERKRRRREKNEETVKSEAPTKSEPIKSEPKFELGESESKFDLGESKYEGDFRIQLGKNASFTSLPLLSNDEEWLREILSTPYDPNFPAPSHQVGFNDPADTAQLFKARQVDLVKHMNPSMTNVMEFEFDFDAHELNTGNYNFIDEALRAQIVRSSSLADDKVPPCEDLNNYMRLYELEFNKYFPFVHLASLKSPVSDNLENIPLLLSMASIGALYSYHDTNTVLLFNLSKFHIQNFFEKEITLDNLQFKKVPLMALQCLVLHIFISMFLNEPNMIDVTSRQIKSMVGLIKSTNFNEPLEHFLNPPAASSDSRQLNFDYFILAQSRVRTLHVFYMLQAFRASLIDVPVLFDASMLRSGTHCRDERLWQCESAQQWSEMRDKDMYRSPMSYPEDGLSMSAKSLESSIVNLSNGRSFSSMVQSLKSGDTPAVSFHNALAMLMYIHEQIQVELPNPFSQVEWQLNRRPRVHKLLCRWELVFNRSGGTLHIDASNKHLLAVHHELKVIVPLYLFARIKLVVNLNPIISPVLYKNWDAMNAQLASLAAQEPHYGLLRQALPHCLDLVDLWACNMESMDDSKSISLRSPVFFVSTLFVSALLLSTYLRTLEARQVSADEALVWLRCAGSLLKVESLLQTMSQSLYSESLTKNASYGVKEGHASVLALVSGGKDPSKEIRRVDLGVKCLYLGIRILADAPVWPIAMGFAEGLKSRGVFLEAEEK